MIKHCLTVWFIQERKTVRENGHSHHDEMKEKVMDKRIIESGDSSGFESTVETTRSLLPKKEIDDED